LGPEYFSPPPKVDSSVLYFKRLNIPLVNIKNRLLYDKILLTVFNERRKMIRSSLKKLKVNVNIEFLLEELKINPTLRPQELSIFDFVNLSNKISELI
jgi:16S rRNA (adenine1518-N6/adenine1519-N6)-dimethyltransferase